ncbi:TldD/PmbA family protein [Thermogymnomonas acidicola]|uniref:metallopeptidase TldD-related protein n=1 Tax=Thermogymnomonas acidicola TaxID=399579 RepID=UPI000946196B|nr:metallopeptidase TldD-related protein [Thermogymnomonas acidicola]
MRAVSLDMVVRAFRDGGDTGQEQTHVGPEGTVDSRQAGALGRRAGETASLSVPRKKGEEGRYTVLLSPHVLGNLMTYSEGFLSSYSVDTGLSCFIGMEGGKEVASEAFSLWDVPQDRKGEGYTPFDDEGTETRNRALIERGTLKTFMHSYSTGRKHGRESTGNAGVLYPHAWQLQVGPGGGRDHEKILDEIENGIVIGNTWYTRFQDYRSGTFSTVPRDGGVFLVRRGEIKERWEGMRISDSVPSILRNVIEASSDMRYTRWWEEISASLMPYVLVDGLNISRGGF